MSLRAVCLATALIFLLAISLAAQTGSNVQSSSAQATKPEIKNVPARYTDPSSGKEMYLAYCASCHGADGKGNGPAAPALKTPPTGLTQLTAKNGGKFPDAHIAQVIKGDVVTAAHGNKEMPVWGPVLFWMGQHDPAQQQLRIRNLTKYIESIQQK